MCRWEILGTADDVLVTSEWVVLSFGSLAWTLEFGTEARPRWDAVRHDGLGKPEFMSAFGGRCR